MPLHVRSRGQDCSGRCPGMEAPVPCTGGVGFRGSSRAEWLGGWDVLTVGEACGSIPEDAGCHLCGIWRS